MTELTTEDVTLLIDEDFADLLPTEPIDELLNQVVSDGVFLTEIVAWECEPDSDGNRAGTIVDGHRRYQVWKALPEDTPVPPPRVRFKEFSSKSEAMLWAWANQDNRRNMTRQQLAAVRKRLYEAVKADPHDNLKRGESPSGQNVHSGNQGKNDVFSAASVDADSAATRVGKATGGVDEKTVRRDSQWVDAVQAIQQVNSKAAADLRSGSLKPPMADVIAVGKLDHREIASALKNWRNGRKWNDDGTETKTPSTPKPKKGSERSPAKVVDDLKRTHVSPLVKGMDSVAEINGGKGAEWKAAKDGLDTFLQHLDEMREGKQ